MQTAQWRIIGDYMQSSEPNALVLAFITTCISWPSELTSVKLQGEQQILRGALQTHTRTRAHTHTHPCGVSKVFLKASARKQRPFFLPSFCHP